MELYATTAIIEDRGKLTVHDKTQGVQNVQRYLCGVFKMKPGDVRVVSPYVGGAFGSGLRPQYQVVLAVLAARALLGGLLCLRRAGGGVAARSQPRRAARSDGWGRPRRRRWGTARPSTAAERTASPACGTVRRSGRSSSAAGA